MKCPTCIKEKQKSQVFPGSGSVTLLGWHPYYDEDGEYHSHDPNWHSTSYSCSNGHKWNVSKRQPCLTLGCDWPDE